MCVYSLLRSVAVAFLLFLMYKSDFSFSATLLPGNYMKKCCSPINISLLHDSNCKLNGYLNIEKLAGIESLKNISFLYNPSSESTFFRLDKSNDINGSILNSLRTKRQVLNIKTANKTKNMLQNHEHVKIKRNIKEMPNDKGYASDNVSDDSLLFPHKEEDLILNNVELDNHCNDDDNYKYINKIYNGNNNYINYFEDEDLMQLLSRHRRFKRAPTDNVNKPAFNQTQNNNKFMSQLLPELSSKFTGQVQSGNLKNRKAIKQTNDQRFYDLRSHVDYDEDMMNNYLINVLSLNEVGKLPHPLVVVKEKNKDPLLMVTYSQ